MPEPRSRSDSEWPASEGTSTAVRGLKPSAGDIRNHEAIGSRNRCWRFTVAAGVLDRSVDVISVHVTKERAGRLLAQGVNAIERASLGRSKAGHGSHLTRRRALPHADFR